MSKKLFLLTEEQELELMKRISDYKSGKSKGYSEDQARIELMKLVKKSK